ncbi:unnamed protein product [Ectocarpus sp. 4 AP-2014]
MWLLDVLDPKTGDVSTTVAMVEGIHTLGRKGSSVSFPEDRSVSRKHAEIRVGPVPRNDPTEQPIWVKDVGSKLKTCVNGSETGEAHKEISLKEGDEVKVGTTNSIMSRVRFQALRFCATQLTAEEKAELKALSKKCGGAVSRKWDAAKCTHLVTLANTSSVTEKLVLALLGLRPVVHVGWLKDLAAGGTAKPLRPVPETEAFGPVVTRSRRQGPFRVRHTADRRTHLSGDFFAILHKDELVETIVEAAGGALCRAYAMSDDDFAGQDWQEWSAGRQSHFVSAGPEVSLSAKAKAVLASRGEVLEDVGMEATDKTQLTEAVVYLQSLVNVREAMRASSSSIAPMAMNTSSEAWGPSQSLAASQLSKGLPARAAAAMAAASAEPAMPPPTGGGSSNSRKAFKPAAAAAAASGAMSTSKVSSSAAAVAAVAAESGSASERKEDVADGMSVDKDEDGDVAGGSGGQTVKEPEEQMEEGGAGNDSVAKGKRSAARRTRGREREDGPGHAAAEAKDDGRGAERQGGIAGAGGNAAGKKASSATAAAVADDDRIGDLADDADGVPVAGPTPGGDDDDGGGGGGPGSGGGGGGGGGRPAKRKRCAQPLRRDRGEENDARGAGAGDASVEDDDKQQDEEEEEEASLERRGGGSQQRSSVPAPAPGGWMTAHNASSSQKDKRPIGGRVRKAGGVGGDTEGEVEEDEDGEERARLATPADPAVTEMCRQGLCCVPLVAKAVSRSAPMGYSRSSSARPVGGRRGPAVPNFKRFKKNTIMFGGEQVAAYVPLAALRSTLPKESERELALAEEQQQLEAEEARGPKRQAWPFETNTFLTPMAFWTPQFFASFKAYTSFGCLGCSFCFWVLQEPRTSEGARGSPQRTEMITNICHTHEP